MNVEYIVLTPAYNGSKEYKTYEEAETAAKKTAGKFFKNGYDRVVIYQAVAEATAPVPDVTFTKLS